MTNYLNAILEIRDSYNYYLAAGEKRIIIPVKNMHKMCDFSGMTDSKGLIRPGTRLHLVEIQNGKGTLYYPNHRFYHKPQNNNSTEAQTLCRNIESIGIESESVEFKRSFSYNCMNGIIETIAAFANSGHEGTLIIGVNDSGIPIGLHDLHNRNDQKLREDDLRNRVKQKMGLPLSRTLSFDWSESRGKMICKIMVPTWTGEIIFLNGNKVYCRMGSTNQLLTGRDLVEFIKNRQCSSQTAKRYPINLTLSSMCKSIN